MEQQLPPVADRVESGVQFLNRMRPDWRTHPFRHGFTMGSTTDCLLCKVEHVRSFSAAMRSIGISPDEAVRLGFLREEGGSMTLYGELQAAWIRKLTA